MATNAVYKIYNGTNGWVDYHLKTNAAQVIMTNARKFITSETTVNGQAFSLGQNDNTASVTINGSHITCATVSAESLEYISATDSVAAALGKLDKAAKDAYNHVPADVLTSSNYAQTLGNVYAAIGHNHSGVYQPLHTLLTAISELGNIGAAGILKIGESSASVDTTNYVPDTRTINGKRLNGNVTLTGDDIMVSDSGYLGNTSISSYFYDLREFAEGKTKTLVISLETTGTTQDGGHIVNSRFNSQDADITFYQDVEAGGIREDSGAVLIPVGTDPSNYDVADIAVGSGYWRVGDILYIKETNVPDRWVSDIQGTWSNNEFHVESITFSKLETSKVDLTNYATRGTTLAHYGITDAKIENGVITLGGNTITPLTQHQDLSGRAPNNHASSATTYGLATADLYGHVKLASGDLNGKPVTIGVAASQNHTHSQYLTSHQSLAGYATETWVDNNFVRCTASKSAPSNPSAGDIWIDTNN